MCGTCDRRSKDCFYDPKKDKLQRLMDDVQQARERIRTLEGARETLHQGPNAPAPPSSLTRAGKRLNLLQCCRYAGV
jgi:hypothetical protein